MSLDPRLHRIVAAQPYPLLFATISGAHLYGFPSPDSDFDLRGAHILPLEKVVGLDIRDETVEDSCVIVDQDYAEGELTQEVNAFKQELFGRTDIVLHTADITRNRNGFERMQEAAFRERFYEKLNGLMRKLNYMVVACAIRKDEHLSRYGVAALDPYLLSLDVLVERLCFEVGDVAGGGVIVAEKREPTLDRQLDVAWLNLKIKGTRFLQAKAIERRILGLNLRDKSENIAGLQLADLVVTPIGRQVLGKSLKEDWRIVEAKLRRGPRGKYEGYGLVVLPK